MSLTRTEVFQALADEKPVQLKLKDSMHRDEWYDIKSNYKCLSDAVFLSYDWRIKPEKPKWYENIPSHGILCWVGHDDNEKTLIALITSYYPDAYWPFFRYNENSWKFATPLSNDEIRQFLREEE